MWAPGSALRGARRGSRRQPTLPPHLSRAPTMRTPPLAACGFLLLFVVWLGFFWGGREAGDCSVCASGGGSQVRGPDAPPPQPAWGVSLPTRVMWNHFFSYQCSAEKIFSRAPASLTACAVHLPPPCLSPFQHPIQERGPQLRSTWREEKGGAQADPHAAPLPLRLRCSLPSASVLLCNPEERPLN